MSTSGPSVVVVDTNFVGRGTYKSAKVRKLAERLHSRDHELVVPEVVVWEWTAHLHDDLQEAAVALSSARKAAVESGLELVVPDYSVPTVEEIAEKIESDLHQMPGVRLIPATLIDAATAIRQQVLQVGLGVRKTGVKTGAADALVVAALEFCLSDASDEDSVVLCSNDDLLCAAAAELEWNPSIARTERDLWGWFGTTKPTDTALADAVQSSLRDVLQSWFAQAGGFLDTSFPLLAEGFSGDTEIREHLRLRSHDPYQLDIGVVAVDDLQITEVEIVSDTSLPHIVLAEASAIIRADVVNWYFDEDGQLQDEPDSATLTLKVLITADFDVDWSYDSFECSDAAELQVH